jgi:hypothetical protein
MDIERSFLLKAEDVVKHSQSIYDLPPAQVGVSAALRRAFALPAGETERQFEQLLSKLC